MAKAFIVIKFLNQPSSIASKMITLHPPCAPRRSCVLSYPSPIPPGCFWLVVVHISIIWRPFQAASFFCYNLLINSTAGTMTWCHPTRFAQVGSLLHRSPTAYASYFLIVALFRQMAANKADALSLSLSLLIRSILCPKLWDKVLPTRSDPASPLLRRIP